MQDSLSKSLKTLGTPERSVQGSDVRNPHVSASHRQPGAGIDTPAHAAPDGHPPCWSWCVHHPYACAQSPHCRRAARSRKDGM